MTQGRLQQTVSQFKAQLMHREAKATQALNYAHARTVEAIQPKLDNLYRQITAKQQAGEDIPLSWLYEQNRLSAIKSLISNQIDHFGAMAQVTTGQLQHQAVQLGQQAAQAQLQATVPAGIHFSFGVPHPQAIHNIVGATQAGSPLADLFSGFGAEAAKGASDALITGITLGQNPREIAPQVEDALGISRSRALTIARTSMLDAYRSANMETFRANADVVEKMVRVADLSPRSCAACIALNGTEYDLDEDPGFHPNDRCVLVPKTKGWDSILGDLGIDTSDLEDTSIDIQDGSEWFNQQDEATQREILGNAKFEAFQEGKFQLSDLVGHSFSEDWGNSIYERSLQDTLAAAQTSTGTVQTLAESLKSMQAGDMPPATLSAADTTTWIEQYLRQFVPEPEAFDPYAQMGLPEEVAATKAFTPLTGTVEEKEQYLTENGYNTWIKSLTASEQRSVIDYTGSDYRPMNNLLRFGKVSGYSSAETQQLQKQIDLVQSALLKSSAPTDLLNVRGYGNSQLEAFKTALQSGKPFIEKGFYSSTILDKPSFSGFRVITRIYEGAPGAYIKPVSEVPGEQEYLLPHGAELKVVDGFEKNGKWTFVAEYHGIAQSS